MGFNDYLFGEISKSVLQAKDDNNQMPDEFSDIFLGQNQVPLTDELIEHLVKEKGMNREELIYMQKEGAKYSVSRNSFIFPPEGDLDKLIK
ncbi:uncharacterized protein TOL2_C34010 [Desulfobacula toluolica Tol2]|uniref:Uncharacterized protein n=2 Tax=Desulfobacula toluolica TaxID=28223 RepID=K0NNI9_DESTT|nr:uncharacterized protein TOL2_C34010 [Desulfobacula toluolica Tol2]